MSRSCTALAGALLLAASFTSRAAVVVTNSYDVVLPGPVALRAAVPQGERVLIAARFLRNARPLDLTGCTADYLYRTNGMASWWTAPASVSGATVYVPFGPELDPGASAYVGWVRVLSGTNPLYRCELLLRMLSTPGHVPNASALALAPIDFSRLTWTNAPWATSGELSAEISARAAGDLVARTNLQAALTAEAGTRAAADTALITSNTAARAATAVHAARADNPHSVTAAQVGAWTASQSVASNAATRAAAAALSLGDALRTIQPGGTNWVAVANGTATLYRLSQTIDTNAVVLTVTETLAGEGTVSVPVGAHTLYGVWGSEPANWSATNVPSAWNLQGGGVTWGGESSQRWQVRGPDMEWAGWWQTGADGVDLPAALEIVEGFGAGSLDWRRTVTTNVHALATLADLSGTSAGLSPEDLAAATNALARVAHTGLYYDLLSRPTVLASNPVDVAAVAFGGASGWLSWTGTAGIVIKPAGALVALGLNAEFAGTTAPVVTGLASAQMSDLSTIRNAIMVASVNGREWVTPNGLTKAERAGPLYLGLSFPATPPGTSGTSAVTRISCDTWRDLSRVGEVFPIHGVSVRVDDPEDVLDAANKAYVDLRADASDATGAQALRWWEQRAQGDAHMGGYRLHLGGDWSILQEGDGWGALSFDGSVGLGVVGDSTQFAVQLAAQNILIARFDTEGMAITAWSGKKTSPTSMYLTVATNGLPAVRTSASAWAEYAPSITAGLWFRVPSQVVSLPTNTATFRITFPNPEPAATSLYFRVMRASGNLAALRSMVPLRAPSMMISESNSVAVATTPGVIVIDSIAGNPAAIATHGQIYAVAGELWVMDGSGNATRISSHDGAAWVQVSANLYTGWGTRFDVVSGARERFRLPQLRDWDRDQADLAAKQADAMARWDAQQTSERRAARPEAYAPRPMPDWMARERAASDKDDPSPIPKDSSSGKAAASGAAGSVAGLAAGAALARAALTRLTRETVA